MKINIGCGEVKLEGFTNIDAEPRTKPDLVCDISKARLPIEDNSIEEVWFHHCIEHISLTAWSHVFREISRVLIKDGILFMSYPEFEVCSRYYIENYRGQKDFWRMTLYGRQLYPGDFHITPVITRELEALLYSLGYKNIISKPQNSHEYYTFLKCYKGTIITKEDVIRKEIFA